MKLVVNCFAVFMLLGFLSGCVKTHYAWNDYDSKLYNHYKDPSQKEEFAIALKESLEDAEAAKAVPPGIYAEYGFLLYEQGNSLESIKYYQKEYDMWPESRFFMSKMMSSAQKRIKASNSASSVNTTSADSKSNVSTQSEATK